jgi:hypothetical protein
MPKATDEESGREERKRRQRVGRARHERQRHGQPRHEDEQERHEDNEQPRRRRMGREHAVHQEIIERRLGGGAPATPEAYAKALEEWHQLPGSVVRPPTDEKPAMKPKKEGEDGGKKDDRP